ncbi:hypothetical protein [Chryseobacterium turcicum]|uniref:Outer membrane protein beta-barrel domain-containing protein n=1 Tax=Chryseobacterium turcicum TaxID=2898076 RepID=A0A9Q3V478_9FLAO|nr:hypothetical protein [Chryseobacterium turcicum]MCD1116395.1 hypothetical protein [Chryseobacterium turcicum]
MKKLVLSFLILSSFAFAQNGVYVSAGAGVLAHKKTSAFDFDVAVGYHFKNKHSLETNYINSKDVNLANLVFGLENNIEKKILLSGFTGFGIAFIEDKSHFNYQLGLNAGYRIEKKSVVGLKVSNNFNKAKTFTAMNVFYRFNF